MSNTFYEFDDSYNVDFSKEDALMMESNMDVYGIAYNYSVYYIQSKYKTDKILCKDSEEIYNYLMSTIFVPNNPWYSYVINLQPLIIYSAILKALQNVTKDEDGRFWFPQYIRFDTQFRNMYISITNNKKFKQIVTNNLYMVLPNGMKANFVTPLSFIDEKKFENSPMGSIVGIDIEMNKYTKQFWITLHKREFAQKDIDMEDVDTIGLYVDSDINNITRSDGYIASMPSYIWQTINKIQTLSYMKETKRNTFSRQQIKELEKAKALIISQRRDWFEHVAGELCNNHKLIAIENQPRISMSYDDLHSLDPLIDICLIPTWLEFSTILNKHGRTTGCKIVNVYKSPDNMMRCNRCGVLYTSLQYVRPHNKEWICRCCHTIHDYKINAAKNVLHLAYQKDFQ